MSHKKRFEQIYELIFDTVMSIEPTHRRGRRGNRQDRPSLSPSTKGVMGGQYSPLSAAAIQQVDQTASLDLFCPSQNSIAFPEQMKDKMPERPETKMILSLRI